MCILNGSPYIWFPLYLTISSTCIVKETFHSIQLNNDTNAFDFQRFNLQTPNIRSQVIILFGSKVFKTQICFEKGGNTYLPKYSNLFLSDETFIKQNI